MNLNPNDVLLVVAICFSLGLLIGASIAVYIIFSGIYRGTVKYYRVNFRFKTKGILCFKKVFFERKTVGITDAHLSALLISIPDVGVKKERIALIQTHNESAIAYPEYGLVDEVKGEEVNVRGMIGYVLSNTPTVEVYLDNENKPKVKIY